MESLFLLFAGTAYYPDGGWGDFRGTYPTVEAARAAFHAKSEEEYWQWYDIVEVRTWQCVETAGNRVGDAPPVAQPPTPEA